MSRYDDEKYKIALKHLDAIQNLKKALLDVAKMEVIDKFRDMAYMSAFENAKSDEEHLCAFCLEQEALRNKAESSFSHLQTGMSAFGTIPYAKQSGEEPRMVQTDAEEMKRRQEQSDAEEMKRRQEQEDAIYAQILADGFFAETLAKR